MNWFSLELVLLNTEPFWTVMRARVEGNEVEDLCCFLSKSKYSNVYVLIVTFQKKIFLQDQQLSVVFSASLEIIWNVSFTLWINSERYVISQNSINYLQVILVVLEHNVSFDFGYEQGEFCKYNCVLDFVVNSSFKSCMLLHICVNHLL